MEQNNDAILSELKALPVAEPDVGTETANITKAPTIQEEVGTNAITPQQQDDYMQESIAQPVPAQNQLPADSYLYANTTSIGGVVESVAEQYNIDPHKLEALTNTIRNKQANLSGFYDMQIGYYPGMSAESLVTSLGRVIDLSQTVSARQKQEAEMRGEAYTSDGLDNILDSLQSIDGKKSGKAYYQEALTAIQEADHMKFDTPTLSKYYETLVKSGMSKADAWTRTMVKQDAYRLAQDERAVKQDIDSMVTPTEMESYASALYEKVQRTSDSETRLRLYSQYQTASQLAKSYAAAYKADPAAYLQAKDPIMRSVLLDAQKSGNYAGVIDTLDARYNELGVPSSQRKYLTKEQAAAMSSEINANLGTDPIKAQAILVSLNKSYGKNAGKVINQLINDGHVDSSAKVLIEASRTNVAASNEDVLNMIKNKYAYKGDYAKEMLGAPNRATAQTMRQKIEARIYDIPGYKALVNQFNLNGNIQGKIEMAQYYADMALFYKNKYPGLSDKRAVEMVQTKLIDSAYIYDAQGRICLPKTSTDGRPLQYGKYTVQQAKNYLSNRKFTGQNLQVGNLTPKISETLLSNESKISYRYIDQHTIQPIYTDDKGTVQSLFTGSGQNRKVYTIDLRKLGQESTLHIFDARDNARKLISLLTNAANIPSGAAYASGRIGLMDTNTANAMKALNDLGFKLNHLDTSKPFNEQFDRTKMSPRRIEALSNLLNKQQEFETALQKYEVLKKAQRDAVAPRMTAVQMIKPFFEDILFHPKSAEESKFYNKVKKWDADSKKYLPILKQQREELYRLESEIMNEAKIFLNYTAPLPAHPLLKQINEHEILDTILWGGY